MIESVYEEAVCHELGKEGFNFERQKSIPGVWEGIKLGQGFRADIIIDKKLILEIKSVEKIAKVHHKQLLTFLKLRTLNLAF